MKRILIAGGTGFVGRYLCQHLLKQGFQLAVLTRRDMPAQAGVSYYKWDLSKGYIDKEAFRDVQTIINLTGANIGEKRWSKKRKVELVSSRVEPLDLLYKYVSENKFPIERLISSSAVGYYGAVTEATVFDESSVSGNDFLAAICVRWEEAARQFERLQTRVLIFRKGVVLAKDGGVYQKMAPLAKWGINPAVGSGKQYMPWVAMADLMALYSFALSDPHMDGVFNVVATGHMTMNDFAKVLLRSFNKRSILPNVPAFMLRLVLGEMSSLILEGSPVSNGKLIEKGFRFQEDVFFG